MIPPPAPRAMPNLAACAGGRMSGSHLPIGGADVGVCQNRSLGSASARFFRNRTPLHPDRSPQIFSTGHWLQ